MTGSTFALKSTKGSVVWSHYANNYHGQSCPGVGYKLLKGRGVLYKSRLSSQASCLTQTMLKVNVSFKFNLNQYNRHCSIEKPCDYSGPGVNSRLWETNSIVIAVSMEPEKCHWNNKALHDMIQFIYTFVDSKLLVHLALCYISFEQCLALGRWSTAVYFVPELFA